MRHFLFAAALLVAVPALAQDASGDTLVVTPGHDLTTDWVTPGTTTWTMKLVQPMQQNVGTMTETYTLADGQVTKVNVLSIPMQGISQTDSLTADAATLTPRLHRSSGGMMEASLEFMAEGVVGTSTPRNGATETIMEMTDAPVFDGSWAGEVVQSLPLEEGLVVRIPTYSVQGGLMDVIATVTGQEDVETADGTRDGWTVDMTVGPQMLTTVIDTETRETLRVRLSPQPGVVIEMVPAD